MTDDRLRAAVAAGVLASEDSHRALLQATVEVARGIFYARASSVLLYDEQTDELVFEAAAARRRCSRTRTPTQRSSHGSRRISRSSTGSAAPPAWSCSGRSRPFSNTEAGLSPASATLETRLRQSIWSI